MDPAEITASIQTILKYNDPTGQLYTPYQPRQPTVQVDQYSSPIKEKKKKMKGKGPMQPGQFHYHDYLSTVESVGYKDTIMTHMQKKKSLEFHPKEKERKERHTKPLGEYHQHSEEKELTSTYEDSFSKEYQDKTESTEFTEGLYKHWSKGHYLKDTAYAKLFAVSELYPKEKERKEPHTKQLGENQYPDKKERIGKSKIPWLKDPYLKDTDISKTYAEFHPKEKERKEHKPFGEYQFFQKEKERKEPHTKQLGENQYPDKKESTGKSKNPWLKDPYLKNKDLPETHDFPSPPELEVSEIVEG